jgi:hypothetical protein
MLRHHDWNELRMVSEASQLLGEDFMCFGFVHIDAYESANKTETKSFAGIGARLHQRRAQLQTRYYRKLHLK